MINSDPYNDSNTDIKTNSTTTTSIQAEIDNQTQILKLRLQTINYQS